MEELQTLAEYYFVLLLAIRHYKKALTSYVDYRIEYDFALPSQAVAQYTE